MEIRRLEIDQIRIGHHTRETLRHFRELFEVTLSAFLLWRTATSMPYSLCFQWKSGGRGTRSPLLVVNVRPAGIVPGGIARRPYC
jgi:hypothetical protein